MKLKQKLVTRTFQQRIKKTSRKYKEKYELYNSLSELTSKATYLYNLAVLKETKFFNENNKIIKEFDLVTLMRKEIQESGLPSAIASEVVKTVGSNFKGYQNAMKSYMFDSSTFNGKPRLPRIKDENEKTLISLNTSCSSLKGGYIVFPKNTVRIKLPEYLKDIQIRKYGAFDINKTEDIPDKELVQVRVLPRKNEFIIEYVYDKLIEIDITPKHVVVAGLDLGIDNFATVTCFKKNTRPLLINGKSLKSYNQFYNKQLAKMQSEAAKVGLHKTNKLHWWSEKRNHYMKDWMHKASKVVVDYLLENGVNTLIVGKNDGWKQKVNMGKRNNQKFVQIPYESFLSKLEYKLKDVGIAMIKVEESYTSGTSFIDNELPTKEFYNKSRRVERGLFKAKVFKINADVNGSLQIIRKRYTIDDFDIKDGYLDFLRPRKINI